MQICPLLRVLQSETPSAAPRVPSRGLHPIGPLTRSRSRASAVKVRTHELRNKGKADLLSQVRARGTGRRQGAECCRRVHDSQ